MPSTRVPESEAAFATFVEGALDTFNWKWYHVTRTDPRDKAGFPDYVAVNMDGPEVLFIEIKGVDRRGRKGVLGGPQEAWGAALATSGPASVCKALHAQWYVWWPEDKDAILERLGRGRIIG